MSGAFELGKDLAQDSRYSPTVISILVLALLLFTQERLPEPIKQYLIPSLVVYIAGTALLAYLQTMLRDRQILRLKDSEKYEGLPPTRFWPIVIAHFLWLASLICFNLYRGRIAMNWQTAANIATTVTAFQLLIVPISVWLIWRQLKKQEEQLKQQTDLTRVANTQTLVALSSPFNLELAKNEEMATIWFHGPGDLQKLSDVQKYQYREMLIWWLIFYENVFFQEKSQLLDQSISSAWMKDIENFVTTHLVEVYWSSLKAKYHPKFVEYIDSLISAKAGTTPSGVPDHRSRSV